MNPLIWNSPKGVPKCPEMPSIQRRTTLGILLVWKYQIHCLFHFQIFLLLILFQTLSTLFLFVLNWQPLQYPNRQCSNWKSGLILYRYVLRIWSQLMGVNGVLAKSLSFCSSSKVLKSELKKFPRSSYKGKTIILTLPFSWYWLHYTHGW